MKISKKQLKRIIAEEIGKVLNEDEPSEEQTIKRILEPLLNPPEPHRRPSGADRDPDEADQKAYAYQRNTPQQNKPGVQTYIPQPRRRCR